MESNKSAYEDYKQVMTDYGLPVKSYADWLAGQPAPHYKDPEQMRRMTVFAESFLSQFKKGTFDLTLYGPHEKPGFVGLGVMEVHLGNGKIIVAEQNAREFLNQYVTECPQFADSVNSAIGPLMISYKDSLFLVNDARHYTEEGGRIRARVFAEEMLEEQTKRARLDILG